MRCAQLSCGIAEDGDPRSVAARSAPVRKASAVHAHYADNVAWALATSWSGETGFTM
jgi:hypothetical protein